MQLLATTKLDNKNRQKVSHYDVYFPMERFFVDSKDTDIVITTN